MLKTLYVLKQPKLLQRQHCYWKIYNIHLIYSEENAVCLRYDWCRKLNSYNNQALVQTSTSYAPITALDYTMSTTSLTFDAISTTSLLKIYGSCQEKRRVHILPRNKDPTNTNYLRCITLCICFMYNGDRFYFNSSFVSVYMCFR